METDDIIRKHPDRYFGYTPQNIGISLLTLADIAELRYRQLRKLPHKITAYFHRRLIKKAWKSNCFRCSVDDYYLVEATDGTIFVIQY